MDLILPFFWDMVFLNQATKKPGVAMGFAVDKSYRFIAK
jgi:hypothetical protein